MPTDSPSRPSAEHQLALRKLFDTVFTFAWRAPDRYGLPAADRDDIAQNVAIVALRRWPTYRESSGTPGQWLWGIVRNEHRAFLRAQGKQPVLVGDDLLDVPSEAADPEQSASVHDHADHLLGTLPIEERRVVVLHEIVGLTYREIAAFEGISKSEAHDRHKSGMRTLAAAGYRGGNRRSVAALPLALADVGGALRGPEPLPQARDAAWQRCAVRLGLPSPAPRSPWRRRAVAGAVALLCLLMAATLSDGRAPAGGAASRVVSAAGAAAPVPSPDARQTPNTTTPEPPAVARAAPPLTAFTARTHEQRFVAGQQETMRARLRELACARLREASLAAAPEPPCAGPLRAAGGS